MDRKSCTERNFCTENKKTNSPFRDDVEVDPEDDDPDDLPPQPGHMNREGSRLRNKIKEAFFSYWCIFNQQIILKKTLNRHFITENVASELR